MLRVPYGQVRFRHALFVSNPSTSEMEHGKAGRLRELRTQRIEYEGGDYETALSLISKALESFSPNGSQD